MFYLIPNTCTKYAESVFFSISLRSYIVNTKLNRTFFSRLHIRSASSGYLERTIAAASTSTYFSGTLFLFFVFFHSEDCFGSDVAKQFNLMRYTGMIAFVILKLCHNVFHLFVCCRYLPFSVSDSLTPFYILIANPESGDH